ncbi:MAG: NAD-dependent epimerase/dehydratase family protein [Pirellulaceae bacterium]
MAKKRVLVTGATGMVGSHVAKRLLDEGYLVRGMARSTSVRAELEAADMEWFEADLSEPSSLPAALAEIDMVVHAAAHVGDWGPAELYRSINVVALEHMLTAAHREGRLERWIQISSLGVYPARHHYGTTEEVEADLAGLDGYTRTKAEAEVLLKRHMEEYGFPAVILRPGFIYGRGDRHVVPRLIERIAAGQMKLIGDGTRVLNNTYVENLSDAVLLALTSDRALGETFNIRDERLVTRNEFVHTIAAFMNCPPPKHVPERVARMAVVPIEWLARMRKSTQAPLLTRARIKFLTQNLDFSIAKAKSLLGYQPKTDFRDGMEKTLRWAQEAGLIPNRPVADRQQDDSEIRPEGVTAAEAARK